MAVQPWRAAHRAARRFFVVVAVLAAATLAASGVAAHGETFFQLGAERVQPGAAVEVRADLGAGDAFEITLIAKSDGTRRSLGTVPATDEGHLQGYLTIPADVAAGDYLVELAYDLIVMRAPLTVAGAPVTGEEGGGPDRGEGLIVPVPSVPGGAASPAGSSSAPAAPVSTRSGRAAIDGLLIAGVAVGAALVLLVGIRVASHRRVRAD